MLASTRESRLHASRNVSSRLALPSLVGCAFFGSATFTSVSPFLNEMSSDLGTAVGLVGQMTTASSLASALSALLLFPIVGTLAPKRLLMLSLAGVGLFSALTGAIAWFPAMLLFQFGVGASSATVATTALIVLGRLYSDPAARAKWQGLLIGSLGSGALLGTPLLRWVAGWSGWQGALLVFGGMAVLMTALVASGLPALPADDSSGGLPPLQRLHEAIAAARHPVIVPALVTSFLIWASWGVLSTFLAGYFLHRYPGHEHWIALIWTVDGLAFLLGALGSGIVLTRIGGPVRAVVVAITGMLFSVASFAWLAINPLFSLACFFVWSALIGVSANALIALYDRHVGPRTPSILFLDSALGKLAMVAGGLSGGLTVELVPGYSGWSMLLLIVGMMALLPVIALTRAAAAGHLPASPRVVIKDAHALS
jgi:predicted MFS family arabinose efflux permease